MAELRRCLGLSSELTPGMHQASETLAVDDDDAEFNWTALLGAAKKPTALGLPPSRQSDIHFPGSSLTGIGTPLQIPASVLSGVTGIEGGPVSDDDRQDDEIVLNERLAELEESAEAAAEKESVMLQPASDPEDEGDEPSAFPQDNNAPEGHVGDPTPEGPTVKRRKRQAHLLDTETEITKDVYNLYINNRAAITRMPGL